MTLPDLMPVDLALKKTLSKAHLQADRIGEALHVMLDILKDYPQDTQTIISLGDIYLAYQDGKTAGLVFNSALQYMPENDDLLARLELARILQTRGPIIPDSISPFDSRSIDYFLESVYGKEHSLSEETVHRAAAILEEIINSSSPARMVEKYLHEMDVLIPAFIEVNIRQAQKEGRGDLVGELRKLQGEMKANHTGEQAQPQRKSEKWLFRGKVALLYNPAEGPSPRIEILLAALSDLGNQVVIVQNPSDFQDVDLAVAFNPHTAPELLKTLAAYSALEIPIIVDLDDDFERMPLNHKNYTRCGLTTQSRARAFQSCLWIADKVTVPTPILAQYLIDGGYPVEVVPDGWSNQNSLWQQKNETRTTINIGWIGSAGQMDDFLPIRRIAMRILHEFPQTQLVIQGDVDTFNIFDNIPHTRRLFLPDVSYADFPYTLGQIDILLLPYQDTPYNQTISDKKLVEAGVKKIPWVASPLPSFCGWQAGGFIAQTQEEWHAHLRQLVMDEELRRSLGQAGSNQAFNREANRTAGIWLEIFHSIVSQKKNGQSNA